MPVNLPGISIFAGAPPLSDVNTTGRVFWVGSTAVPGGVTGADVAGANGDRPQQPFATIDFAVGQCTANRGDVILVLPGHAENISTATSLVVDIAGVSIIGLGQGETRPVLTWTATAGTIEMDAANTRLSNLVLLASVSGITVGINVDAADVELDHLRFRFDASGDDWLRSIDITGVDRVKVHHCEFLMEEAAGTDEAIRVDNTDYTHITDNWFAGAYANAFINTGAAIGVGLYIARNRGHNANTATGRNIDLNIAFTGLLEDNRFSTAFVGAEDSTFDSGSCGTINNRVSGSTADTEGVRVPYFPVVDWRVAINRTTAFDGGTANAHGNDGGTDDPHTLFTVTGDVEVSVVGIVNTTLTGATATIEVGVTGNTAGILPQATGTNLADGDVYMAATGDVGVDAFTSNTMVINDGADIIETVATANVTAGQIDYYCLWRPLEPGARVVGAD